MAELKGIKLQERLTGFENWKKSIAERIASVQNIIPGLDFSPSSLTLIEEYLLERYISSDEVKALGDAVLIDSLCTYIGEVYIRNFKIKLEWAVLLAQVNGDFFSFLYYIKGENNFIGYNPFSRIPFALTRRTGDKLLVHFHHNLNLHENTIEEIDNQKYEPSESNISYNHYLMFKNDQVKLGMVGDVIKTYCIKRDKVFDLQEKNRNQLLLILDQSYQFYFYLDDRAEVPTENKEIILNCDFNISESSSYSSRIEFFGQEDPDGKYLNEFLFLLEQLDALPVLIYDINQGCFWDD